MNKKKSRNSSVQETAAPAEAPSAARNVPRPLSARAAATAATESAPLLDRDTLPDMLISQGQASAQQIQEAIVKQQETGQFLGEILVESGILSQKSLVTFLVRHCKIPFLSLLDYFIDKSALSLIPADICWKYHLLPLDKLGKSLTIAMVNPLNQQALTVVRDLCPDFRIKPILCDHEEFEKTASKLLGPQEGHDEKTWSHIDFFADKTVPRAAAPPFPAATSAPSSVKHERPHSESEPEWETPPALDSKTLLRTVFADPDLLKQEDDAQSDKRKKAAKSDTLRKTRFRKKQSVADTVVGRYNSVEDLLHQITDSMLDSMHDAYELFSRKIPIFQNIPAEDIARLYYEETVVNYDEGDNVFVQGEPGASFYLVLNGKVRVEKRCGRTVILDREDIFGESVLHGDTYRDENAVAVTEASLLTLTPTMIQHDIAPSSAIQLLSNIIAALSQRCQRKHL